MMFSSILLSSILRLSNNLSDSTKFSFTTTESSLKLPSIVSKFSFILSMKISVASRVSDMLGISDSKSSFSLEPFTVPSIEASKIDSISGMFSSNSYTASTILLSSGLLFSISTPISLHTLIIIPEIVLVTFSLTCCFNVLTPESVILGAIAFFFSFTV